jgi:ribosomal protein S18 acetylase RimI-like enzyme
MNLRSRLLSNFDSKTIMKFYDRCSDFFDMTLGEQPKDCHDLLTDLPPNCIKEHKQVIGYFDEENILRVVVDIVDHYPNQETTIIGLILVDPKLRRLGLGNSIIDRLEKDAVYRGQSRMRVAVIEENLPSLNLWKKRGYRHVKTTEPKKHGKKEHKLLVYEKELTLE